PPTLQGFLPLTFSVAPSLPIFYIIFILLVAQFTFLNHPFVKLIKFLNGNPDPASVYISELLPTMHPPFRLFIAQRLAL
ncbi:MAG: hypothetical protein ACK53Y_21890, partial [bacterium]